MKVYWEAPGLSLPSGEDINVTFDLTLADKTAVRVFANAVGLVPNTGARVVLESHYDVPRDIVGVLATNRVAGMAFRVSDTNVYPEAIDATNGNLYQRVFTCFYTRMQGSEAK